MVKHPSVVESSAKKVWVILNSHCRGSLVSRETLHGVAYEKIIETMGVECVENIERGTRALKIQ